MRVLYVLEFDHTDPDKIEETVHEIQQAFPYNPIPLRVAVGDVADRVLSTFVIEGKEAEWKRKNG